MSRRGSHSSSGAALESSREQLSKQVIKQQREQARQPEQQRAALESSPEQLSKQVIKQQREQARQPEQQRSSARVVA